MALLLNEEGVLLWRPGASSAELARRQLRRGATPLPDGDLVELYHYEKLEPNEINQFLIDLDEKLNPAGGLRRCELAPGTGKLVAGPLPEPLAGSRRRLLFIHGTFGKSEAFTLPEGSALTQAAAVLLPRYTATSCRYVHIAK